MTEMKKKIKEQSEIVFSIDKEHDSNRFKNESMNLVKLLYLFVLEKYKNNRDLLYKANYGEYSLEIVNTGLACIKNFDPNHEKGASFLTYFICSWEKECARIRSREASDTPVHVPERDKRLLGQLREYFRSKNIIFSPTLHHELVAKVLGVSDARALEIIYLSQLRTDSIARNEEDEEILILDTIPSGKLTPEESVIEKENWDAAMTKIEKGYESLRRPPMPYVVDIITCDIAGLLIYYEGYSYNYSFINIKMMEEILHIGIIPKAKDIAKKYDTSPQALSRAYTNVIKKIRANQKETEKT